MNNVTGTRRLAISLWHRKAIYQRESDYGTRSTPTNRIQEDIKLLFKV